MVKPREVPRVRSGNLRLDGPIEGSAEAVVSHLGAVQSQDYLPAQWSLAQRASGLTQTDVDRALADGSIIRTHVLRPTWHFLARADARWMLELTGPRVLSRIAHRHRNLGLDARTLARAERTVLKALERDGELTRKELGAALTKARIDIDGQRLPHMLGFCELNLAICSGGRRGKEHTYAAFEEQVPAAQKLDDAEAIRMLVERYLHSHGPAAVVDIQWWSGLKVVEIKTALAELGSRVQVETIDDVELWSFEDQTADGAQPQVRLLETYDEYIVGYTRSRFFGDPNRERAIDAWRSRSEPPNIVTRAGSILGGWRRTKTAKKVKVQVRLYEPASAAVMTSLRSEARDFADFYGLDLELEVD